MESELGDEACCSILRSDAGRRDALLFIQLLAPSFVFIGLLSNEVSFKDLNWLEGEGWGLLGD